MRAFNCDKCRDYSNGEPALIIQMIEERGVQPFVFELCTDCFKEVKEFIETNRTIDEP